MAGAIRNRGFLLGLGLLALAVVLYAAITPDGVQHDAEAASSGPEMALSVTMLDGFCDDPIRPTKCTVRAGTQFDVSIDAVSIPANGYILAQGGIDYGDDLGDPSNNGAIKQSSTAWPDCDPRVYVTTNTDEGGSSNLDTYSAGCLTGLLPPYPVSFYTGSLFTVRLTCTNDFTDHVIQLLAEGQAPAGTQGAAYLDADSTVVPAKVSPLMIHCDAITITAPPPNGPDLLIKEMKIELETGSDCNFPSTNLGVSIRFSNSGNQPAGAFTVEVNGDQQTVPGGLAADADQTLWFKGYEQFNDNVGTVDVLGEVVESNEFNNTFSTPLGVPTLPPTCTPPPTATPKPPDGDTDGDTIPNSSDPDDDDDGCTDIQELGPDEMLGGLRDPHDPWDFYDVAGEGGGPPDGVIDLPNDILGVILHFSPDANPPYDAHYDRGPTIIGMPHWKRTGPDGTIDLPNDILGVILQFFHHCR